jgi:hypothetical protein
LVADDSTLYDLHQVIQRAIGWDGTHLHDFEINGQSYTDPFDQEYMNYGRADEDRVRLRDLNLAEGARFRYTYDFGDAWLHQLQLEKILPRDPETVLPVCLKGKRAGPLEDVGGPEGYQTFLDAHRDPNHPEYEFYREWYEGKYDPEAFDLKEVNAALLQLSESEQRRSRQEFIEKGFHKLLSLWGDKAPTLAEAERESILLLPVRRNVLKLLRHLRKEKVKGTPRLGNFPVAHVKKLALEFEDLRPAEAWQAGAVARVRSEDEIWPVFYIHMLAVGLGLIEGGPESQWVVTPLAETFEAASPATQTAMLFTVWWLALDWGQAYPSDGLVLDFNFGMRKWLTAELLATGENEFVTLKALVAKFAQLPDLQEGWFGENFLAAEFLRELPHTALYRLADFGGLEIKEDVLSTPTGDTHSLVSIRLTSLGRDLLGAMKFPDM